MFQKALKTEWHDFRFYRSVVKNTNQFFIIKMSLITILNILKKLSHE